MSSTSYVMKVSRNGQVSIPAVTRARWASERVVIVDLGDRIVVHPLPEDPVGALRGKYRMTDLDAHAIVAFLRDEPAAEAIENLPGNHPPTSLTPIGVAEVLDRLIRVDGIEDEEALLDLAQFGLDDPGPASDVRGAEAGLLRSRHYHRKRCAVSLADCIAAVVARADRCPVATSDTHLLGVCHAEGISVEVLADSGGRTWVPDTSTQEAICQLPVDGPQILRRRIFRSAGLRERAGSSSDVHPRPRPRPRSSVG